MSRFSNILCTICVMAVSSGCADHRDKSHPIRFNLTSSIPNQIQLSKLVKIQFDVAGKHFKNPYDSDEICVQLLLTCPDGTRLTHPAFYTVDHQVICDHEREVVRNTGNGHWEVRWTPMQAGDYDWQLVALSEGARVTKEGQFHCNPGPEPRFVRVSAADPKYFEFSDGSFFYPAGHLTRSPADTRWLDGDSQKLKTLQTAADQKTFAYERWFEQMAANDENFCSIWMAPWWLGLEWTDAYPGFEGLGRYNQIHAAQLDRILELAERRGIHVLLFVMNHGQFSTVTDAEWEKNPYRMTNGGPAETASDFFQSEECDQYYYKRLNYILARWGYSQALFGISLSTETEWIEPFHGYRCDQPKEIVDGISSPQFEIIKRPENVIAWMQRMSKYIHDNDVHQHLVTTQFARIETDPAVWQKEGFDFAINNCYENAYPFLLTKFDRDPSQAGTANMLWAWSEHHTSTMKPKLIGEWGGSHMGNSRQRLATDLHTGLWSLAMTDCAGATGFWWWNEIEHSNLYPQFKAVHRFLDGYDRRGKNLAQTQQDVVVDAASTDNLTLRVPHPSRSALVLSNETEAFAYVYHRLVSSGHVGATSLDDQRLDQATDAYLTVPDNLRAGRYQIEFWDTFRGELIESKEQLIDDSGDTLRQIALLPFRSELALKIRNLEPRSN